MRRVASLMLLCAAVLVLAGCGDKESVVTSGQEGVSVDVGGLTYQVQISRFLNPNDVEDAYYLRGLPATTDLDPGKDSVWFGVWMRVKNYSDQTLTPTTHFTIEDTRGNKFQPVPVDAKQNPFVFEAKPLPHAKVNPDPNSPPGSGPIQGSLILFRIDAASLPNRPLTLHIEGNGNEAATMQLDL